MGAAPAVQNSAFSEQPMATVTGIRPDRESPLPPAKVEDNTLDEQHAGLAEKELPVTDNDQSSEGGQSHVATESDRKSKPPRS